MVWAITACCCQGFLLLGYDQGVMSGIIGANNQFGMDFGSPDPTTQGLHSEHTCDIGCAVGSLIVFFWGERIGRKRMIMSGATTMLIGTAILTSSTTRAQLYVGRVVTGIGNGFNSSSIPVYQSETCRFPIGFQAVFALALLLQVMVLPDSPRWLLAHGQEEEASRVIALLEDHDSVDHPDVVRARKEIELSLAVESEGGRPFRLLVNFYMAVRLVNFRRICLCIAINVMQQFTGSNMINYLAPVVYQNTMGLSRNLSLILGGCTAITYMVASFIPLWTVDRFGRRPLLMISATGLSVCFILAAILLSIGTRPAAFAATAMVFIFQIFLGIGFLPIISTTRIRARGSAISSFFNWMCVFAVVQMTPPAIANIDWRVFIIFAVFNACWVPIVFFFFPETRGLELEEIDHIFEKGGITGGVWGSPGGRTTADMHYPPAAAVEPKRGNSDDLKAEDEKLEKV
ncbi:general substrate transporter [Gymnopus androsaceus JB14]|uniref:General substrate transporter n=1 Tax=Gymnopus androsaceus JB14 TaxID=1447944 RepID=A0A6A4HRQ9_9AGAR|nr:general substrate transporter [Gymnopus androsaceus JB14]